MKAVGLILCLVGLAACEPSRSPQPDPPPEPGSSGVKVSGYARIGASTTF